MELLIDGMNWRTLERDLLKPSTSSLLFGTYRKQSLSRRFIVVWDHSKTVCRHIISYCKAKHSTPCLYGSSVEKASTIRILKRSPGSKKGAGGKRKRVTKRKDRDQELFPYFHTLSPEDLAQYEDVVLLIPTIGTCSSWCTNVLSLMLRASWDIRPCPVAIISTQKSIEIVQSGLSNVKPMLHIKTNADKFSRTNSHTISPMEFREYVSQGSEANTILGPLYDDLFFRKNRWRSSIGNQRDKALLGNLIRRQFGPNPLIILGNGSPPTARFHAPTKGVGLRMDLLRLG